MAELAFRALLRLCAFALNLAPDMLKWWNWT
jgi:hypothetical protein